MNTEQRLAVSNVTIDTKIHGSVRSKRQLSQSGLVFSGKIMEADVWKNRTCDETISGADLDRDQDAEEAEALQQSRRNHIADIVLETLNSRELSETHFCLITRRDEGYWADWLAFQLRNKRLVLKGGIFRPGPQWAVSLVSMR